MSALATSNRVESPVRTTLLELVCAVQEYADSDREVVAVVMHILESGQVELSGTFAGSPPR